VLVMEAPGGARFALEPLAGVAIEGGAEQLDGDQPIDQRIAGEENLAHATAAEQFDRVESADSVELVHRVGCGAPGAGDPR
jgi:hypothetical protein